VDIQTNVLHCNANILFSKRMLRYQSTNIETPIDAQTPNIKDSFLLLSAQRLACSGLAGTARLESEVAQPTNRCTLC
jgi:hypothetical protein